MKSTGYKIVSEKFISLHKFVYQKYRLSFLLMLSILCSNHFHSDRITRGLRFQFISFIKPKIDVHNHLDGTQRNVLFQYNFFFHFLVQFHLK